MGIPATSCALHSRRQASEPSVFSADAGAQPCVHVAARLVGSLEVTGSQPAAQGTVNVGAEKNGNRSIEVRVEHLSPPERAAPGARSHVVWLVPRAGGVPQNMGALMLQDDLGGVLKTTTPYREFEILVTAEENPGATKPLTRNVMRATVELTGRDVR